MNLDVQSMVDKMDHIMGSIKDKLVPIRKGCKPLKWSNLPLYVVEMKRKLKNMYTRAKRESNPVLHKKSRLLEKKIRLEILKSNTEKIRTEANLGPKNLWKAVKIINGTTNNDIPLLIDDQTNKVSTNLTKAELFSETFENKISDITSNIIPDMNQEPYRRMIFGSYEENWITE